MSEFLHAFSFRTPDSTMDFVFISVHLKPGDSQSNKNRRKHELTATANWIDTHNDTERDFIILGDMNIKDAEKLIDAIPTGFILLNNECRSTNTLKQDDESKGKPYDHDDHVMYDTIFTSEIDEQFDLEVVNLIEAVRDSWASSDPYPGDPYDHNLFKQYYSDHHPVVFRMIIPVADDD